jgi:hypothetical protein
VPWVAGLRGAFLLWNSRGARAEKFIIYTSRVGTELKFWVWRVRDEAGLFWGGHAFKTARGGLVNLVGFNVLMGRYLSFINLRLSASVK